MEYSLELANRGRPKPKLSSYSYGFSFSSLNYRGDGACLSHDHGTQFTFVLQSLTLWRNIMTNMPKLWMLADTDMTTESYRLCDTGQGYQRLQYSPCVREEMSNILQSVKASCGSWVGLSVVHLGDRDVPNALVFIDKYVQVPSILAPIVAALERLPSLTDDKAYAAYVYAGQCPPSSLSLPLWLSFVRPSSPIITPHLP